MALKNHLGRRRQTKLAWHGCLGTTQVPPEMGDRLAVLTRRAGGSAHESEASTKEVRA